MRKTPSIFIEIIRQILPNGSEFSSIFAIGQAR